MEQDEGNSPALEQRSVRPWRGGVNAPTGTDPSSDQIGHPSPIINGATQGRHLRDGTSNQPSALIDYERSGGFIILIARMADSIQILLPCCPTKSQALPEYSDDPTSA